MQTPARRFASAFTSLALILGTAACGGGGGDDATDQASAAAPDAERATALARRKPPPPPAATTDATLALASATASGQAVAGNICGVSADGAKVLFTSPFDMLVSGDNRPFLDDIFLKNFNGNDVVRVVNTVSRSLACLAMNPDANTGVFTADATNGQVDMPANLTLLPGSSAPLSFSDDGRRVSYVQSNGLGGQFFNSVPRVLDLSTGAIVNAATLSNGTVGNGNVTVSALLSRDGRVAAFDNNSTNLLGGLSSLGGAELRAYRKLLP